MTPERDLPPEYARDLEQMLAHRAEAMARTELGPDAWSQADEALGRSVSERLAAERDARVAMRDASHDVSAGADWRRVATNHVPFEDLARRRAAAPQQRERTGMDLDRSHGHWTDPKGGEVAGRAMEASLEESLGVHFTNTPPDSTRAAVERARQAVADLPAPRVSPDDESTRWSEDRARNDVDTLER